MILGTMLIVLSLAWFDLLPIQVALKSSNANQGNWAKQTVLVTWVIDGDTFWVSGSNGEKAKVRILSIDAPEICQVHGQSAKQALAQKIEKRKLNLHGMQSKDKYGRLLAVPILQKENVAAWLVRTGNAWNGVYKNQKGDYAREQTAAKNARVGLWSTPNPEKPSAFRKRRGSCYHKK